MEDENGIELSLGLSCGGSSSKSKVKDVPLDPTSGEGSRSRPVGGSLNVFEASFKPFLPLTIKNPASNPQQQMNDLVKSNQREGFWPDLGQHNSVDTESRRFPELWSSSNQASDADKDKSGLNKRKLPCEDVSLQKKPDKGGDHVGGHGKGAAAVTFRNHVTLTKEDASSGENEDAAESEAEGSSSWLAPPHEENARGVDVTKATDKHFSSEQDSVNSEGLRQSKLLGNEPNVDHGKSSYGIPLSLQSLPVRSAPYQASSRGPAAAAAPNTLGFPSTCVMQLMPFGNSEQAPLQPITSSVLQYNFGYSSVQLPTLETHSSWIFGSQPHHQPSYGSKGPGEGATNLEHSENGTKISPVPGHQEQGTPPGRLPQHGRLPYESSAIKPGIAASLIFGGSGSCPDLPWVSATGAGPSGKTISGVTYKYSSNQVKIVCACHGTHMTPEEFLQHAGSGRRRITTTAATITRARALSLAAVRRRRRRADRRPPPCKFPL
ncbi:unnamed protein product [Spirodela intermedia]|uniref:Ninja-family protein n=1 Tax=Spirodela intermedia TaxID=51605 RepID=A0A7I8JLZ1_SPIIN|nr:unnamed protein product [Spirodela intermedia]CAA6671120.1 unnamed protein product [Spirodela intermedia]